MSAEKLMLQGRYFSKVRKYGVIGGVATIVGGVITYVVVQRREKSLESYLKSLTPEKKKATDDRVMKFAGLERDERFPHVPMLNNSEGDFTEFYQKYKAVDFWLIAEKEALISIDPDLYNYFPDLVHYGIRENWFDSESEKAGAQQRLANARSKLKKIVAQGGKSSSRSKDQIKDAAIKTLVVWQLKQQEKEGLQSAAAPLAVKYLPKVASEE